MDDSWIPSVCYMCYNTCRIRVRRSGGVITSIEGLPGNPYNGSRLCAKGRAGLMSYYNPRSLTTPLRRTNPRKGLGVDPGFVQIGWEEALELATAKLREVRARDPRGLLLASFDLHAVDTYLGPWLAAFGSPNFTTGAAGWFCGNAVHPIAWLFHGSFYTEPDWDRARYALLIGSQSGHGVHLNPMHAAPKVAAARARGLHVVVVDPVLTNAAACAQEWIPIRPGTDAGFALGLLNQLLNELEIYDREFIRRHTNGPYLVGPDGKYMRDTGGRPLLWDSGAGHARPFTEADEFKAALEAPPPDHCFEVHGIRCRTGFQLLKEHVRQYTPERVAGITTVPASAIRRIARELGEAASIGSTIIIGGEELPYRPAFVEYGRGVAAHRHGMLSTLACELLNVVLGAVDVPGGSLGIQAAGPGWFPASDADGLLVPAPEVAPPGAPHPLPEVPDRIRRLEVKELFPLGICSRPMLLETILEPEKYGLDYRLEILIHCRNNFLMNTAEPGKVAESLSRIPFQLSFARTVDETVEFADLVLPDTHYLESLVPFPEEFGCHKVTGTDQWCHALRQPVIPPAESVRNWHEVLFDLADRAGFRTEFHHLLNRHLGLAGDLSLEPTRTYHPEEIVDRVLKARLGPENGLAEMKIRGFQKETKPVRTAFPRPFSRGRLPLYAESFVVAGERVRKSVDGLGLESWDTSDYQPVPDWKPCAAHREARPEYDLWVVNSKLLYQSLSYTADNPWLSELADCHPHHRGLIINKQTALKKGLSEGDRVRVETPDGLYLEGTVHLRQGIHPEVLATFGVQGQWGRGRPDSDGGKGIHFNRLIRHSLEQIDFLSGALDGCVKVKLISCQRFHSIASSRAKFFNP